MEGGGVVLRYSDCLWVILLAFFLKVTRACEKMQLINKLAVDSYYYDIFFDLCVV